jgi:hypothetical protein
MQPYFDPNRKTTSKKDGRGPHKKWKTTSKNMEDNLNKFFQTRMKTSEEEKMEDDLKMF